MNMLRTGLLAITLAGSMLTAAAGHRAEPPTLKAGDYVLTLQWLQNAGGVGKATLYPDPVNQWRIEGHQEERYMGDLNVMDVQGTIRVLNARELDFTGTITTRISYINHGAAYVRKGTFRMKAWGARKFWRMQNMTEPDGQDEVTDYIDLHFRQQGRSKAR